MAITCPSCKNDFVQPFVCVTCGAWKLYDATLHAAQSRAIKLETELAAAQKDAERYRWLRTAGAWESEIGMDILSESPEQFDAAVDTAIANEVKNGLAK